MSQKKKSHTKEKSELHALSKHKERYDFKQLITRCPELKPFVKVNAYGDESIDFFNPDAVKMLNTALLKHFYNITYWDIPKGYLCPPIPGRADYIHHIAEVLQQKSNAKILDIGVGANCIYPIIGVNEYGWNFVGSDIDPKAIESAQTIVNQNSSLKESVELRLQPDARDIFKGIIKNNEVFDMTICNPPFHSSLQEAQSGTLRKLKNLKGKPKVKPVLNFGGQSNELWCDGGEVKFVKDLIYESKRFSKSSTWFSTLVSKETHLKSIYKLLKKVEVKETKTIPMQQGQKVSRIVMWRFVEL